MESVVVCPHLDDAVLSCGRYLAARRGATVITVFAGSRPESRRFLTKWDKACGFRSGDDVMALRRKEDAKALTCLGAKPVHLPGLDLQYRQGPPDVAELADEIAAMLKVLEPRTVLAPLGLLHEDHRLTSEIAVEACQVAGRRECVVYADLPYARTPGLLQLRVEDLTSRFGSLTETSMPLGSRWLKHRAINCYATQVKGLGVGTRLQGALVEERYWLARFAGSGTPASPANGFQTQ